MSPLTISIAKTHCKSGKKLAYIAGGETIVNITGHGKGGRNQEIALSAAEGIKGMSNAAVFSMIKEKEGVVHDDTDEGTSS